MKFVRTVRAHETLVVPLTDDADGETVTINRALDREGIADAKAKRVQEVADDYGIPIEVLDEYPEDADSYAPAASQAPADLSAGVSMVSGTGAPVLTTDESDGDDADEKQES